MNYILFNKHNGDFVAELPDTNIDGFDLTHFKVKELDYDLKEYGWRGNFVTGKPIPRSKEDRVISEVGIKQQCRNCILKEYPTDNQINNLTDAILEIVQLLNLSGPKINILKDQKSYIDECLEVNKKFINAYKNDPDWIFLPEHETEEYLKEHMISCEDLGIHSIDV